MERSRTPGPVVPTRARAALHLTVVAALVAAATILAGPAHAATFAVTKQADTNDGACDADCSLREAVVAANSTPGADTVTLRAGTYALTVGGENEDASATGDLDVTDALTVDGVGSGATTVSAGSEAGNPAPDLDDRVFDVLGEADATFSDLTVSGGNRPSGGGGGFGGGIRHSSSGGLTIIRSTVSDNASANAGGGIYSENPTTGSSGDLTITDSALRDNLGESGGGGIANFGGGALSITDSAVDDNTADNSGGGIGSGGISNVEAVLTVTRSTVNGNVANGAGGGIYHFSGEMTITDSAVSGNQATSGGGVRSGESTTTITGSTVSGNASSSSFFDGGGISNSNGAMTVTRSTVSGNSSASSGGGIYSATGFAGVATAIENSTVSGNSADDAGGGVFNISGLTTVESSTITDNSAPTGRGSGVANSGAFPRFGPPRTEVGSSVVAANDATDVDFVDIDGDGATSFVSGGYNVVGDGNAASAFNQPGDLTGVADPGLGPLTDNGGPTQTHALLPGSPAIDRIVAGCPPPNTDQRGLSRPRDGDGDGVTRCDSGAFERGPGVVRFASAAYSVDESGDTATITVVRTGGSDGEVSVDYSTTSGGTAAPGSDYTASAGTLTFADGDGSESFSVPIVDDARDEPAETANLALSNPQGAATLGDPDEATLTITDDDAAPALSITNRTVAEGDTGAKNATFTVTLSAASAKTVTVRYATANGTARQPADYFARSGTLIFSPGQTRKSVVVRVRGDRLDEPNERFSVVLSGPANAAIADRLGTGTITDDAGG